MKDIDNISQMKKRPAKIRRALLSIWKRECR